MTTQGERSAVSATKPSKHDQHQQVVISQDNKVKVITINLCMQWHTEMVVTNPQ